MNEINTTMFLPICDKTVTAEAGCEFSMPDYQPEIRRLLRVNATLLPPTSYVGAGKAEFVGAVRYDMLYSAADGGLYATSITENYQLSAPLDKDADVDFSDETVAFCEPRAELLSARVTAPRKLSIRCRIRGDIRAYGKHRLTEQVLGEVSEGTIQRLGGDSECAFFPSIAGESFSLSHEIMPGEGDWRVVSADAVMTVSESVCSSEGIGCRGDASIKLILCREGEDVAPVVLCEKIPFAVTVPAEGFRPTTRCRARARCTEVASEIGEDGRIRLDLSAAVQVEGQENIPLHYTADLYSTERTDTAVYEEYRFPRAACCFSGNFTQSVYEPLASFDLAPDCEVLDAHAWAQTDGVTFEKGRYAVTGTTRVSLLTREGGEYAAHELELPFRYESEGEGGDGLCGVAEVFMTSGRARADSGRLSLECEMAVSARVVGEGSVRAPIRVEFGGMVEKPCEMVVAFPERGESLWSVAKRYHVSAAELARMNGTTVSIASPLPDSSPIVVSE